MARLKTPQPPIECGWYNKNDIKSITVIKERKTDIRYTGERKNSYFFGLIPWKTYKAGYYTSDLKTYIGENLGKDYIIKPDSPYYGDVVFEKAKIRICFQDGRYSESYWDSHYTASDRAKYLIERNNLKDVLFEIY